MKTLFLAAATASMMATVPAAAAPEKEREMIVHYDDLNLASAKGQKILERRLTAAARAVCGLDNQKTGTRIRTEAENRCFRLARATAMERHAQLVTRNQLGG